MQSYTELQAERDIVADQFQQKAQAEADWQARHAEAEQQHSATQEQLSAVISERDGLIQERATLQTEVEEGKNLVTELQQKLAALSSELSLNARQMKRVQAELRYLYRMAVCGKRRRRNEQSRPLVLPLCGV